MFKKTKYDIIKKEMKGTKKEVILLGIKALLIIGKYKKGELSTLEFEREADRAIEEFLPVVKKCSHLCYENSKDIETMGIRALIEYVEEKGMDSAKFIDNYTNVKRQFLQILMAYAEMDKEGLEYPNRKYIKLLSGILYGDFDDKKFELNEDKFQLLEDYHNRYMMENIYPKVTKEVTSEEVLKIAKSFVKKRR